MRREVVTLLGYEHLRRHDLRHAGLTWMADAGVPVRVLRKIAGMARRAPRSVTLHADPASVAAAGEALGVHLKARRSQMFPAAGRPDRDGASAGETKSPADLG